MEDLVLEYPTLKPVSAIWPAPGTNAKAEFTAPDTLYVALMPKPLLVAFCNSLSLDTEVRR